MKAATAQRRPTGIRCCGERSPRPKFQACNQRSGMLPLTVSDRPRFHRINQLISQCQQVCRAIQTSDKSLGDARESDHGAAEGASQSRFNTIPLNSQEVSCSSMFWMD